MKLSEAIKEFSQYRKHKVGDKTVVRYESALRIFCLCMGDPYIEKITMRHIVHYLDEVKRLGWKTNGVLIIELALRKLFKYWELEGLDVLNWNHIPLERKEYNIPRVADEESYKKILEAIPRDNNPNNIRNLAIISMLWDSGARSGELLSLNVKDLDFKENIAMVRTEKVGRKGRRPIREVCWSDETNEHIKRWIEKKEYLTSNLSFEDSDALFISIRKCSTKDTVGKRMTNNAVCEMLRRVSNTAGLPTVYNAHSNRHRVGREIIERGGTTVDVANILGHAHESSAYIYTMLWGKRLKKRYDTFFSRGKVKNVFEKA